jgi:hypothetical protein
MLMSVIPKFAVPTAEHHMTPRPIKTDDIISGDI